MPMTASPAASSTNGKGGEVHSLHVASEAPEGCVFLPFVLFALAQSSAPVADETLPPPGTTALITAEGRGVQIYGCNPAPGNNFQWVLDAPLATLYQPHTDTMLGTHTIGPTWTWIDGSSIKGTVSASKPAPDKTDAAWLRLKAQPVSTATGTLARVAWVRRSDTKGGAAPATGCDAAHEGVIQQVPYTATYTFYSGAGLASPARTARLYGSHLNIHKRPPRGRALLLIRGRVLTSCSLQRTSRARPLKTCEQRSIGHAPSWSARARPHHLCRGARRRYDGTSPLPRDVRQPFCVLPLACCVFLSWAFSAHRLRRRGRGLVFTLGESHRDSTPHSKKLSSPRVA